MIFKPFFLNYNLSKKIVSAFKKADHYAQKYCKMSTSSCAQFSQAHKTQNFF